MERNEKRNEEGVRNKMKKERQRTTKEIKEDRKYIEEGCRRISKERGVKIRKK
jgi:hypothetical protein